MWKPKCKLIGQEENVFFVIEKVTEILCIEGLNEQADEFNLKYKECKSYDEVLRLAMDYVEII